MRTAHIPFIAALYFGCVVEIPPLASDSENAVSTDSQTPTEDDSTRGESSDFEDSSETDADTKTDTGSDADTDADSDADADSDTDTATSGGADFIQTDDGNGLVIIEAEDFSSARPGSDSSTWQESDEPGNYTGEGAMQALPLGYQEHTDQAFAQENAPVLEYTVRFVRAEPVYVWGRASHTGNFDDSLWFGKDGEIEGTSALCFTVDEQEIVNQWYYIGFLMNGNRAMLDIDEVGIKTIELYMREPGFVIDQIVLTTNPDYNPSTMATRHPPISERVDLL